MAWVWRYRNSDGGPIGDPAEGPVGGGSSEEFPSQSDAESWLGEGWKDLYAGGVRSVMLEEDGRQEYVMPLTAE
jgi:hypothetical protein